MLLLPPINLEVYKGRIQVPAIESARAAIERKYWPTMSRNNFILFLLFALPLPGLAQNNSHTFFVKSYGGKCLDFGPPPQVAGAPVFLYACNGTVSQQVRVVEPDPSPAGHHRVILFAGSKVLGVKGNVPGNGIALELQDQNSSVGQTFQLDGDSIISGAPPLNNLQFVVQTQNNRGANRTPLVLGYRELKDAEFWSFSAVDGSATWPTSGFTLVTQSNSLAYALNSAGVGSVIVLDGTFDWKATGTLPLKLNAGVTLRSDRRLTDLGARITWTGSAVLAPNADQPVMLDARADFTRITGVRLTGPSCTTIEANTPKWNGILADDAHPSLIDHNELSCWTTAGVGTSYAGKTYLPNPPLRLQPILIVKNFIHHNPMQNFGYGVVTGSGSIPLIEGNTFLMNRHAIASDGTPFSGYEAFYNLVLSTVPGYPKKLTTQREQDFDMHGRGSTDDKKCPGGPPLPVLEIICDGTSDCGGCAGQYMNIGWNTFLGTALKLSTHYSFFLRGTPSFKAVFHDNIVRQSHSDAIENAGAPSKLVLSGNHFGSANQTDKLGVGDFDGDGKDDLFLATGAAWYYSSAGKVEWRFLNAQTDPLDTLLFGDFDGDGRTDILKLQGQDWMVSWGGASPWEKINQSDAQFADLAVGDFDGDGRSDIFYTDGHSWFVSSGGTGPLTHFQTSSFRVPDLRFGDFNQDGKTDVFAIVSGAWQVSYGALSSWTKLRNKLTDSVVGLMIADFDGDGKPDVALRENGSLRISSGGTGNWTTLSASPFSVAAFGRFQSHVEADLLVWENNYLDILVGGKQPTARHNPEEMR